MATIVTYPGGQARVCAPGGRGPARPGATHSSRAGRSGPAPDGAVLSRAPRRSRGGSQPQDFLACGARRARTPVGTEAPACTSQSAAAVQADTTGPPGPGSPAQGSGAVRHAATDAPRGLAPAGRSCAGHPPLHPPGRRGAGRGRRGLPTGEAPTRKRAPISHGQLAPAWSRPSASLRWSRSRN